MCEETNVGKCLYKLADCKIPLSWVERSWEPRIIQSGQLNNLVGQMHSEQLDIRMSRLTHSFFSSLNLTFWAPTFSITPPWLNMDIDINISLHESISKRNGSPELLRLISLDHINRYNTYTHNIH